MDCLAEHMVYHEVTPESHTGLIWDKLRESELSITYPFLLFFSIVLILILSCSILSNQRESPGQ